MRTHVLSQNNVSGLVRNYEKKNEELAQSDAKLQKQRSSYSVPQHEADLMKSRKAYKQLKWSSQQNGKAVMQHQRHDQFHGWTVLLFGVYHGDLDAVKDILSNKEISKDIVNVQLHDGTTALMAAVLEENTEMIDVICASGETNVNLQNAEGETALMLAVQDNLSDAVEILLQNEYVDMHIPNHNGETAVMMVLNNEDIDAGIVQTFATKINGPPAMSNNPLHRVNATATQKEFSKASLDKAVAANCNKVVEDLLKKAEAANKADAWEYRATALKHAVAANDVDVVRKLVARADVDVNAKDKKTGWTVLMDAAWENRAQIVLALLTHDDIKLDAEYISQN